MDVVLTSFGMGMKKPKHSSIFSNMPPMFCDEQSFEGHTAASRFRIDYATLFMFDRVIIDKYSYESAVDATVDGHEQHWLPADKLEAIRKDAAEYGHVLRLLRRSGRLVTKQFDEVFAKAKPILDQATAEDMKNVSRWARPIELAVADWSNTMARLMRPNDGVSEAEVHGLGYMAHILNNSSILARMAVDGLRHWKEKQPAANRDWSRELLRDYISYANFNLLLSFEYQAPFIDWMDMRPIYEEKFRATPARQKALAGDQAMVERSRRLFNFLFPYFVPKSPTELMRAIEDKRSDGLRQLIKEAVDHGRAFDAIECIQILKDILRVEHKTKIRRNITGWVTLPLGFAPLVGTPIQKAAEELVNHLWSNRPTEKYQWFYLISDIDVSRD